MKEAIKRYFKRKGRDDLMRVTTPLWVWHLYCLAMFLVLLGLARDIIRFA